MKIGKLSENVWKRSVLKQIKTRREEVITGAGIGEDCAVFSWHGGAEGNRLPTQYASCAASREETSSTRFDDREMTSMSIYTGHWSGKDAARFALHGSVNALAASGAEPVAVEVSALLPKEAEEACVKEMAAQIEEECGLLGLQVAGCRMEVTGAVNRPAVTVAGIGKLAGKDRVSLKRMRPMQDIVVSKWIGLEGTAFLAANREEELLTKYPARFLEDAKKFDRLLSVVPEAATAVKSGVCAMHSVTGGGIFGALWEMAAGAGVGLEIDLKRIPVKQETIEICEFFELNPYEMASGGCLLMASDKGYDLVRDLEKAHVPAAVIGKTTDGNDRVVINGEERRFLEIPKPDEIYKAIGW